MCKIHPILFNTDMVRAVLDGRKTVTRQVIKFPANKYTGNVPNPGDVSVDKNTVWSEEASFSEKPFYGFQVKTPCLPGDILYVRETWNICNMDIEDNSITFIYKADEPVEEKTARTVSVSNGVYEKYNLGMAENNPEWRPSIHMPKEAARIWLEVTDVRVERLQDIDDAGIAAEGLEIGCDFEEIWDSVIKKADIGRYGWDADPWVWVIGFERCGKPEKWLAERRQ